MTAALTVKRSGDPATRDEYDETDAAARNRMAARFDAIVTDTRSFAYSTREGTGTSERIFPGEFPAVGEQAEVIVIPQYSGG